MLQQKRRRKIPQSDISSETSESVIENMQTNEFNVANWVVAKYIVANASCLKNSAQYFPRQITEVI